MYLYVNFKFKCKRFRNVNLTVFFHVNGRVGFSFVGCFTGIEYVKFALTKKLEKSEARNH